MKYKYLEDVSLADVAFLAEGKTLEELFEAASLAVTGTMVDLKTLNNKIKKTYKFEGKDADVLLYDWLSEIIYIKDVDQLLFKEFRIKIEKKGHYKLTVTCYGDRIDFNVHKMGTDVKAITMHNFKIEKEKNKYKSQITIDL